MRVKTIMLLLLGVSGLFGCTGNHLNEWDDDGYFVIDVYDNGELTLCLRLDFNGSIGRIDDVHFIGANDNFIIVQDTKEMFWILNKEKDDKFLDANQISEGPFLEWEFDSLTFEYGIENIEFTTVFD